MPRSSTSEAAGEKVTVAGVMDREGLMSFASDLAGLGAACVPW
jgi:hypothetical protein